MQPKLWEPGETFLIHETVSPSPFGLPGIPGTPLGVNLNKVQRRVYQFGAEIDVVNFRGRPLSRSPGTYEWVLEALMPGQQITAGRLGKQSFMQVYYGILNLYSVPFVPGNPTFVQKRPGLDGFSPVLKPDWKVMYGYDPIPQVRLYGNPQVSFTSAAGSADPTALAFFHRDSGRFVVVSRTQPTATVSEIMKDFLDAKAKGAAISPR